jgi:ParB family chromosome partitioning protein
MKLSADDVAKVSYVDPLINGREQAALTRESVEEICKTIPHQQFFPAIGRRDDDGRIEILDGSRRRAASIFVGVGLDVLVTQDALGQLDARHLATSIQTAREHNLREVGLRLKLLLEQGGMNQGELAVSQGLSPAKVTRALQAASVPTEMLSVFPIQAELTYPDYRALKEINESLSDADELDDFIHSVQTRVEEISNGLPPDQYKATVMKYYKEASREASGRNQGSRAKVEQLWRFKDRNTYARRRHKGRTLSFEFNRLPASIQSDLDQAIREVLKRHLSAD